MLLQHQQDLNNQLASLERQRARTEQILTTQREQLESNRKTDAEIVADGDRITTALSRYRQAQANLKRLQTLQTQASPLMGQQQAYRQEIEQERQRLQARRDSLQEQLEQQLDNNRTPNSHDSVEQEATAIANRLEELQKLRVYRQRVLEKGQERRTFVEQLQERQRTLQRQWQQLESQCHQLQMPGQSCPLCEQVLQGDRRTLLYTKQLTAQEDISEQIWVIREQLAVGDREKAVLQQEYRDITEQLVELDTQLERHGRLAQKLEESRRKTAQRQRCQSELTELEQTLTEEAFALSARRHLAVIDASLTELNYTDKDLALCRSEVDHWRWAAFKQSELRKAQHRLVRTDAELDTVRSQLADLHNPDHRENQAIASLEEQLASLETRLQSIPYDSDRHTRLRQHQQQLRSWHTQATTLKQAATQLTQCESDCDHLKSLLQQHRQAFSQCQQRLEEAQARLQQLNPPLKESQPTQTSPQTTPLKPTAAQLEQVLARRRHSLDDLLSQLGAKRQQLQQLDGTERALETCDRTLARARRQVTIYRELAIAYGRNGIPALIIETVLPKLEAEANQLLARLSQNQLQLQFITQRANRNRTRTIDTLDILIADPRGTRPYETYSGGEAFRINFAIRLALSRLLAQRSGANLQTLLIDEGFGSQDVAGRDRLVAAINAVAPDFACILAITHIPSLRDRFPSRIQVHRTASGSQLELLS